MDLRIENIAELLLLAAVVAMLARKLRLPYTSLGYRILGGERNLTTKHIKKLAQRFHVGPEVFL